MSINLVEYANHAIDWLIDEPIGNVTYDGIPFIILSGDRAALKTATYGRPTWPDRFSIPIEVPSGVKRVHAIVSGSWVQLEAGPIGAISIEDQAGRPTVVDLVKGVTIQESWRTERDLFDNPRVSRSPGIEWRTVYTEEQRRGTEKAFATFDVLSVDTDPTRIIKRVDLIRLSQTAGVALAALTLQR